MILIYTHSITPRVKYIFKHIFTRILQNDIKITNDVEEFVSYSSLKFSYTKKPLGDELFIKSNDLLFEQGINYTSIDVLKWDDVPCFFSVSGKSAIPFDIFAASFYLISRYEEYLPHLKDEHKRFQATESIAFKHHFLEKPIVDIWAFKFQKILQNKLSNYTTTQRKYNYVSLIQVNSVFKFKSIGLLRSLTGFLNDLYLFNFLNFWNRLSVLLNIKKDPFDAFDELIKLKRKYKIATIFFFSVGDYTKFDSNVSITKKRFKLLIKNIADYALVGLQASYHSMKNLKMLKKEIITLEKVTNIPVLKSRQLFLRISLPKTYQNLIDLEIKEDYSMTYPDYLGFRASTCTPFYFYDLDFEIQTPLKVYPVAITDTILQQNLNLTPKQSIGKIRDVYNEVKKVNGTFLTVFHSHRFNNYLYEKGFKQVYNAILKFVNQ